MLSIVAVQYIFSSQIDLYIAVLIPLCALVAYLGFALMNQHIEISRMESSTTVERAT